MENHETLIRLARQIASERGCDYDAKGAHKAHWRKRAEDVLAIRDTNEAPALVTYLMRAMGWQV